MFNRIAQLVEDFIKIYQAKGSRQIHKNRMTEKEFQSLKEGVLIQNYDEGYNRDFNREGQIHRIRTVDDWCISTESGWIIGLKNNPLSFVPDGEICIFTHYDIQYFFFKIYQLIL